MEINRREESCYITTRTGEIFTSASSSPDKSYLLMWYLSSYSDKDLSNSDSDIARIETKGIFSLVHNDKIQYRGETSGIDTGRVANNGTIIFSCCANMYPPKQAILIMDINQNVILKLIYDGYGGDPGISADGQYACWSQDYKTHFYDIQQKKLLWQRKPEGSNAIEYDFDVERKIITFYDDSYGSLRYGFDGSFLDQEKLHTFELQHGYYNAFRQEIDEIEQTSNPSEKQRLGKRLFQIITEKWKQEGHEDQRPMYARLLGEMFEAMDMPEKAIEAYRKAIYLNPKVGVKRKLAKLEEQYKSEVPSEAIK